MKQKACFLEAGQMHFQGRADRYARFVQQRQLLDASLWAKFVNQFRVRSDTHDNGWRGEYWGKMMRGACLTYYYTQDEVLYSTLTDTVEELLTVQEPEGRYSTYDKAKEFNGWDMWSRKYVITGLLHYYDICRSEKLKARILASLIRHADAVLAGVGEEEGKIPITKTSDIWGGLNSCSILEPMVALYRLSGEKRFLDFAGYIVKTGGCSEGNLLDLVNNTETVPGEFPVTKAYEMMSFFEGVLLYGETVEDESFVDTAVRFFDRVMDHEISVIGCAGCIHELFDRTSVTQTEATEGLMQETCVTVTWMRVLTKLLLATGQAKYAQALEVAAYNALPGSVNTAWQTGVDFYSPEKPVIEPFPFDSYSPLVRQSRGMAVGGLKKLPEGGHYGCCACIGSAGTALSVLTAWLKTDRGLVVNDYLSGTVTAALPDGKSVSFAIEGEYIRTGVCRLTVTAGGGGFPLALRVPEWCDGFRATVNGNETYSGSPGTYMILEADWQEGDVIQVAVDMKLRVTELNGKISYSYGPSVLGWDSLKCPLPEDFTPAADITAEEPQGEEAVRFAYTNRCGQSVVLTDYASCGKDWNTPGSAIGVWL